MIIGAHSIVYSNNPEADRTFFRDVLKFKNVYVGDGRLIMILKPNIPSLNPKKSER